jgi:hypothetical protein
MTMKSVFFIDHDHETGEVRGLLCRACNTLLGCVQDDAKLLGRAINYLIKHARLPVSDS